MPSILLIDDEKERLEELKEALESALEPDEGDVNPWIVARSDENFEKKFEKQTKIETTLVVTDHDLSALGPPGLYGESIVGWCQSQALPVINFTRNLNVLFSQESKPFEFRLSLEEISDPKQAAKIISGIYRGFRSLKEMLETRWNHLKKKNSPAAVLADILDRPGLESDFALYGMGGVTANAALLGIFTGKGKGRGTRGKNQISLLCYILGHQLANFILKFPGPILSERALYAYLGIKYQPDKKIINLFTKAAYKGPFSDKKSFFWLQEVDSIMDSFPVNISPEVEFESPGEYHRTVLEKKLKRELPRHECLRCDGKNGGYFCPLTQRTVCQRDDCSVGSSSWIPQGARLSRIEREYFDEQGPILGF